ncbi:MAG TPA: prepilin-type N-terminal cleavage/methylation domain-containing protein [Myxococcaceae bacterium]|nr:prepilin-type N-terminal cleavage/methylation domain-containing protein [Myxococcaceae bacterium]
MSHRGRASRGFTLVEAMVALAILLVAITALFPLQMMGVRMNRRSERTLDGTLLATDLSENITRWAYTDPRLNPLQTISSFSDSAVAARWDMGTSDRASQTAEFSDSPQPDQNASTYAALGAGYQGLSSDIDGDGTPDFTRYWNVYALDTTGSGTPSGKLIQVIVRWNEPKIGWHQVVVTTFKRNPANLF